MNDQLLVLAIPGFLALMVIEILWCYKHKLPYYRFNDSMGNLTNGLGQLSAGIVTQLFFLWCYQQMLNVIPWRWTQPIWPVWIGAFVFQDFCYYWFHRASHRINWMVGSHVVHHQSEEYNLSVALRQSWLTRVYGWFFYLPMAIAGIPIEIYISTAAINLLFQFWVHTRLIDRLGILEFIIVTPSHHRVHHGKNYPYLDKNYAGVFIFWDKLFGTFAEEKADNPVQFGTVTAVHSWNPLWANLRYYVDLAKQTSQTQSWKNKIKIWWSVPEWKPADVKPIPKPTGRYDHKRQRPTNILIVCQYALCLGIFLFASYAKNGLEFLQNSILAFLVLWGLSNIGGLLDERRWALTSQILWLFSLAGTWYYYS